MGKTLILTEKPSVAGEYADILHVGVRRNGFYENDQYVITWCVGHLIEMCYPEAYDIRYKKWNLADLPFLPEKYQYAVIDNVKKQYEIVHGFMQSPNIDKILYAGDSGREGEVIIELIRNYGGVREGIEERRVWIDSCTEEEITRGIREAKPIEAYDDLAQAGIMRGIEDYAMGINFSRALSVKYGNLLNQTAGTKKYKAIAIGRVMTCVLGMVVRREREIRNFVETPFYRVLGTLSPEQSGTEEGEQFSFEGEWRVSEDSKYFASPLLYSEKGFRKKEDAENLIREIGGPVENGVPALSMLLEKKEKSTEKKRAPLLFNLAELQAECTKRFKISPDETLAAAQALYEGKLTTYPRTDARVLTTAIAGEITKNLSGLYRYQPVKDYVLKIRDEKLYTGLAKTQYVDDSKVTDHYAIIPTGNVENLSRMSDLNKKIYDLIVRRFLSIFYPPAVYEKVNLTLAVPGAVTESGQKTERFYASVRVLKEKGYLEIAGVGDNASGADDEKKLAYFSSLRKGAKIPVQAFTIKEGKTSPPKRYTSGSMILAMENAGQLIEDEELRAQIKGAGIGTSATRAGIIEKLVNIGYLGLNKKTQVLTPKPFGEMVFEVASLTLPSMLNPEMTASWEKGLAGVESGTITPEHYRQTLENYVRKYTDNIKNRDLTGVIRERIRAIG